MSQEFLMSPEIFVASRAVVFRGLVLRGNTSPLKTTAWEARDF